MIEIRRKAGVRTTSGGVWTEMPQIVLCEVEADTLVGADLRQCLLPMADLRGFDLRGADLSGLSLHGTDFRVADLRGAILTDARHLDRCHYDEDTVWPAGMAPPTAPERTAANVRRLMDQAPSAEEWSARHGRRTLVFGYDYDHFADPAMQEWVRRVGEIIRSDALLREMEERYLTPEEVASIRESAEEE